MRYFRSIFQTSICCTMREIKVTRSALSTIASNNDSSDQISGQDDVSLSTNVQYTPEIEKTYVHRVYDAIAPHFSSTRFAKWPKVAAFLSSLQKRSLILDAGCGNGKYLGLNPDCFFIGCDISSPLVNICCERGHEVLVADAVNLPYRSGFGDAAISIAVLHHLSTENRRRKAIEELVRVVRKGGHVLITVWAVEQEDKGLINKWTPLNDKYLDEWIGPGSPCVRSPRSSSLQSIPESYGSSSLQSIPESDDSANGLWKEDINETGDKNSVKSHLGVNDQDNTIMTSSSNAVEDSRNHQEYFVPWHLPYHRAEVSGASASAVASGLAKKDDKKGAVVYNRYYHVFGEGELERLVVGMKNAVIVDQFFDKSNWCLVLEKTE